MVEQIRTLEINLSMILNIGINNRKAFSLLEMTIVLIIMSILLSAVIPVMTRDYLIKASNKTAMEIENIQNAALSYYIQKGAGWPSSINSPPNDLESTGYLPANWNPVNPFQGSYTISSTPTLLAVSTTVRDGAQNIVANYLPQTSISGTTVTSSIGIPGVGSPVHVVSGTIGNGGTIPLPDGYTDSQCHWTVSANNALVYDSSGKGGCENLQTVSAYLTGPDGRTAVATDTGDCRGSWTFSLNYMGICTNS